jgi:hypothetical protein
MCLICVSKINGTTTHHVSVSRAYRISNTAELVQSAGTYPRDPLSGLRKRRICVDAGLNPNPIASSHIGTLSFRNEGDRL